MRSGTIDLTKDQFPWVKPDCAGFHYDGKSAELQLAPRTHDFERLV